MSDSIKELFGTAPSAYKNPLSKKCVKRIAVSAYPYGFFGHSTEPDITATVEFKKEGTSLSQKFTSKVSIGDALNQAYNFIASLPD